MLSKVLFINFVLGTCNSVNLVIPPAALNKTSTPTAMKKIMEELPWSLKVALLKGASNADVCTKSECIAQTEDKSRRVGVQYLQLSPEVKTRRDMDMAGVEKEDNNMKMKLFRLMYETVRDSDLKVKRAERLKNAYTNTSCFELGYLLGDITDKFNIMTDISLTLKRLYHEWRPIEHINAYEQIANMAIEVGHITDMIRGYEKKLAQEAADEMTGGRLEAPKN